MQSKKQQRWLWLAIDHRTRKVLAYVLGTHEDEAFLETTHVGWTQEAYRFL
ncbi:MAG: IS1 family transposase [Leptolyngbyaceae cyanobacterium bins.59]|nr:IS1 family transposase [Leptolyngbyaceae cyanobacterium bins.59]